MIRWRRCFRPNAANADSSSKFVTTGCIARWPGGGSRASPTWPRWQLSPHLLRHFAASDLYRNGMDVVAIPEVLGQRWLNTTMRLI
ncbi:tyrosine-type recombinase/integrase [Rhodococcus opacus]|nr:tyrosine-type recombinase/integrase [Rhodococcus opacus]